MLEFGEGGAAADPAGVAGLDADVALLSPPNSPAVSDFPVADSPAHHQREVVSLNGRRALAKDPALIAAPSARVYSHHHRAFLQLLGEFAAAGNFVVVLEVVGFLGVDGLASEGAGIVDGGEVGVVVGERGAVALEVVIDVFGRRVLDAGGAAVNHLLLRKPQPRVLHLDAHVLSAVLQHLALVHLKLHGRSHCEDVRGISITHVLRRRHEVRPVVVVVVLEFSDFEVALGLSDGGDHVIEGLELCLCDVGEAVDLLVVVLLQLLVTEDHLLLRHVEHEPVELLLLPPVTLHVLLQEALVG